MKKIFIDGKEGTTGLRIYDRLSGRSDIERIVLSEEERKDTECRRKALNESDIAFLCLPDAAAIEAVGLISNPDTVVIDTSTAHRTNPGFTYGFPELDRGIREKLAVSKRIAVPGCHASGFVSLIKPLVMNNLIGKDQKLSCFSITGYSGGGKKMISLYDEAHGGSENQEMYSAPRQYALSQQHKHLKEMRAIPELENEPIFCPIVADYYSGMEVTVPLFKSDLKNGAGIEDIRKIYRELYNGRIVRYIESGDEGGFLSAKALSGSDTMQISVYGNEDRILLVSRFDNLGKGASGAAVQCMNIVLERNETEGLVV